MSQTLYIPIPHYPPFTLRSSLIDKDPVIWAHLLEGYIKLCGILLTGEVRLDVKSSQQFHLFLKVFLTETSEERSKIFSLGAINPDIRDNTNTLRAYVCQVICDYGLVKIGLSGESLWHFVMIFVEKNASLVRTVLAGSHKSKFNDNKKSGKISSIPVLRKHLLSLVTHGQMRDIHLKTLSMLLGQHVAAPISKTVHVTSAGKSQKTGKMLAKDKYKQSATNALQFAELFVVEDWIEELESIYADGKSVHAEEVKKCMVISVLSLSVSKLAKIVSTIGIHGSETMSMAPLLSSILLSDAYKKLNPGLEEKLPFLRSIANDSVRVVASADVEFLLEMFPALTTGKANKLLLKYDNKIDRATNALVEDLSLIDSLSDDDQNISKPTISNTELERGLDRFKLSSKETNESFTRNNLQPSASDTKKRTLTAALRLLYESDEDERDDTYDDQEHTTGTAFTESEKQVKSKGLIGSIEITDEGSHKKSSRAVAPPEFDSNEVLLFGFLKAGGDELFEKGCRKSSQRKDMRLKTGWTDEQIEGWSRMLKRSSKRFRLLEEHYMFHNSNKRVHKVRTGEEAPIQAKNMEKNGSSDRKSDDKIAHKKNEANKAKKANHSRKTGHSKKTRSELVGMQ